MELEEYDGFIFVVVVLIAVISSAFYVFAEEQKALRVAEQNCENAGWTWFAVEEKCIMVKEVK